MFGSIFSKQPLPKKTIKHKHLVLVDRDKCSVIVYPDSQIYIYQYPETEVLDGDVLNRETLRASLTRWIQEKGFKPTEVVYVVTPHISFEKLITQEMRQKDTEAHIVGEFMDSVPFQKIVTARLMQGADVEIIVTNRELINSITYCFDSAGFTNIAVYPYKAIGTTKIPQTGNPLTDLVNIGMYFLDFSEKKNAQAYEFGITMQVAAAKQVTQLSVAQAASQEVSPMIAVVIILFFIILGGGVMYWRFDQVNRLQKSATERLEKGRLIKQEAVEKAQTITPTPQAREKKAIEILYIETTEKKAKEIGSSLESALGYKVTYTVSTQTQGSNSVVIDPTLDQSKVDLIKTNLVKSGYTMTEKRGTTIDVDAVIQILSAP